MFVGIDASKDRLRTEGRPAKAALVAAILQRLTFLDAILRDQKPWQTAPPARQPLSSS